MCFLPPNCIFCRHYNEAAGADEPDCAAFAEIPDCIFRGDFDHRHPYPGDRGVRFELNPEYAYEFAEVAELREQIEQAG
jgi:hypothetical protein